MNPKETEIREVYNKIAAILKDQATFEELAMQAVNETSLNPMLYFWDVASLQ